MKKIFTLLCAAATACGVSAQTVNTYEVTKKADFTDALTAIAGLAEGSTAYVYITGDINAGTLKNGDGNIMASTLRNIHFIGINDPESGEQATLRMEMQLPAGNTESSGFSMHFKNLRLMQSQGVWGNSKHLMNFKDSNKHYIDSLEFVDCELTELCRSFYRAEAQNKEESAGTMKYFRMENCEVHNGFRQSNAMPMIYMAQPVNEMVFRNNTFYDLTYLNGIVSFGTMTENTGRQAVKVTFENNTICAWSKSSLLGYANGVSAESVFHIKNNIVMQPYWADDMNNRFGDDKDKHGNMGDANTQIESIDAEGNVVMVDPTNGILTAEEIDARIAKGVVLTNLDGGLVQQENNLLYGYKYQNLSAAINEGTIIAISDDDEEEGEFTSLAMEDVPFTWGDFTDAPKDMFQINIAAAAYTAGKNGAPLGNVNNYTDKVIKLCSVTTHVEGSKSATITVSPEKATYQSGDQVTLTANLHGNLNTFLGWSNGMTDLSITIELEDDLDITAKFDELPYIAVWNLDQIAANNVVVTPPALPNYGSNALTLDYARYVVVDSTGFAGYLTGAEGAAAYDGAKAAIQTRNNKVSGDIRNCYLITTPNTQFVAGEGGNADYLFINLTEAQEATKLQFFVASDNVPYKNYAVSYTANGTEWTDAATFTMENRTGTNEWYQVVAEIPALEAGSQVRIKGIEADGYFLNSDFQELMDAGSFEVNTEFLFVSEIILLPANGEDGIAELTKSTTATDAPAYNLMGIRVQGQAKGLLVKGGKKFIVR